MDFVVLKTSKLFYWINMEPRSKSVLCFLEFETAGRVSCCFFLSSNDSLIFVGYLLTDYLFGLLLSIIDLSESNSWRIIYSSFYISRLTL
jgi:hypothetical protein